MLGPVDFLGQEHLRFRLAKPSREVVFLVGAPLTMPSGGSRGVPGVAGVVERIRDRITAELPSALAMVDAAIAGAGAAGRYQEAFKQLRGLLGQDHANAVVREAVLEARRPDAMPTSCPIEVQACRSLENDLDGWSYPPAVAALGQIVARSPDRFGKVVLTTNFDPLVELAVQRAGGRHFRTVLHDDGSLEQSQGDGCHVVHLHGHWYGSDTLHDPTQLGRDRPKLRASLRRLLQRCTVVVMAYGGWDDIFTRALAEVADDPGATPEVIWSFHGADPKRLRDENEALLGNLAPAIGRGRVVLYAGIDCHAFLPALAADLGAAPASGAVAYADLAPVRDDADFVGREAERNALLAAFDRGQAVQLLGPRRMGKSSLLWWMERKARELGRPAALVNARGLAGRSPADLVLAAAEALGKRKAARAVLDEESVMPGCDTAVKALETLVPACLLVDEADALAEPGHGFERGFFDALRALGQDRKIQWISASERDLSSLFQATGLTSQFLNDARQLRVGALPRKEAEARLREHVKDPFRVSFAWEVAGGLPPALKWIGPKLAAADADPAAVEKDLARWIRPLFVVWWERLGEEERGVLKKAVGDEVRVGDLTDKERRVARGLADNGFLVEEDGGRLVLGGKVWREFVRDVD